MRLLWGMMLLSGCVAPTRTIDRFPSQRMALSTLPVAPLATSGAPGLSLAARLSAGDPQPQARGGGVAFPAVQPEVGALVQLGDRTWVGGRLDFAMGAFGTRQPPGGARVPESAVAFELALSAGHDLPVNERWGLTFSGEFGVSGASLTSTSALGTFTIPLLRPAARAAIGAYFTPGPVRLFLAGSATTAAWNDATSTITQDCFSGCTTTDDGVFSVTAVGMIGGGARLQATPNFSLALELWVPFTAEATRLPPMLSLTLRAGDFVVRRRAPAPAPQLPDPPPPPPPEVEVAPLEPPPQL